MAGLEHALAHCRALLGYYWALPRSVSGLKLLQLFQSALPLRVKLYYYEGFCSVVF